jgi:hypothetical protein
MRPSEISEPWRSFLTDLDELAGRETHLECLGGFVLTQLYGLPRQTADLDSLSVTPNDQIKPLLSAAQRGSALQKKPCVYLDLVRVARVPEDYESRLTEMFAGAFKHLRLYALDPYDLALAKLSRNIQRDRDDVKFLARTVPFDLAVLKRRYEEEMRIYVANPQREDLTLQLWIEAIEEERTGS